ncbi:MAG: hypothetical protein ACK5MF_13575 [Vibrio sp.]|uniref:hypothetical protein n=1 Tax=Vibrio sp. TaxID=678 RepID=UPI003A85C7F5
MQKNKWLLGFTGFILILPIIGYVWKFYGPLSEVENDWASFAAYMSGLYTPILTFGTLWVLFNQFQLQKQMHQDQINYQKDIENQKAIESRGEILSNTAQRFLNEMCYRYDKYYSENSSPGYQNFLQDLAADIHKVNDHLNMFKAGMLGLLDILEQLKDDKYHHLYNEIILCSKSKLPISFLSTAEDLIKESVKTLKYKHFEPVLRGFAIEVSNIKFDRKAK